MRMSAADPGPRASNVGLPIRPSPAGPDMWACVSGEVSTVPGRRARGGLPAAPSRMNREPTRP